ncbi:EpsD family peptidyl-prolyl cis-trans isomerase [Silvimonas terrae]|uniref:peptidylprolyl isomerase n=1 Tax=Silvimonas terrae TaxID=300266 RepID=A0A840REK3_9NEIS|nr:EpsD family peptidyl-prolyl cis-trans isomerase [Silvimonas terrae]MBB5190810.1 EpsD family peptidyl-prolyl cis-trans isomerase [Silvimonas terrae]
MVQQFGFNFILALAVTAALSGCKNDTQANAPPSQVLARVNGDEITVNQLNYLLASQKSVDDQTRQRMLENLVTQDVLVQKAVEAKLDRDPRVLSSIEFSRRQILAQAMLSKEVGTPQPVTDADVQKFYAERPELFEKRNIYTLDSYLVANNTLTDAVKKQLDSVHTPQDMRATLQAAGITFREAQERTPPEKMPQQLLKVVTPLKAGDVAIVVQNDQAMLVLLDSVQPVPASLKDATPAIQAYLQQERAQKLAEQKIETLKKAAKVEYVQQFAAAAPQAAPAAATPANNNDHIKSGMGLK